VNDSDECHSGGCTGGVHDSWTYASLADRSGESDGPPGVAPGRAETIQGAHRGSIHSTNYRSLLALIRQLRLDAGLNQTEVADRLRRPQSWISKVEVGSDGSTWRNYGSYVSRSALIRPL